MSSWSDITQQIAKEKKKSTKKKSQPTPVVPADHGKNEGEDPHWAYEPPEGATLFDHIVDAGAFEWDNVKDDEDVELWLIRAPHSIKAKHLNGLEIDPPSPSRTARVGSLTRKNTTYDVWSIDDEDAEGVGGEELQGLSCLLPRKRKAGRLYIAPKHVSQHIIISARPAEATPPEHSVVYKNAPRPSYPKDVLKHSFVPYGARSEQSRLEELLDGNDGTNKLAEAALPPENEPSTSKEVQGKKRKVGTDSPKKSKKHKADT